MTTALQTVGTIVLPYSVTEIILDLAAKTHRKRQNLARKTRFCSFLYSVSISSTTSRLVSALLI